MKATHWMDDRRYVITDKQRKDLGSDYRNFYNVPCRMVSGKPQPIEKCSHCDGTGLEPMQDYGDCCSICGGSGGKACEGAFAD